MARQDSNKIVDNVRVSLAENRGEEIEDAAKASVLGRLQRSSFPVLRSNQAVDKIPDGPGMRFPKQVFGRFMRLFTAKQATYNDQNLRVLETLANEIDELRAELKRVEGGPGRVFGLSDFAGSDDRRLHAALTHHFHHIQRNLSFVTRNMEETSRALVRLVEDLGSVSSGLGELGDKHRLMHEEVAESKTDLSRLWTELGIAYDNIDQRAEDLWRGINDRDAQLLLNREAVQGLHRQVGSLEANSRELKARMMVVTEQLALQQEMIENFKHEFAPADGKPLATPRPVVEGAAEAAAPPPRPTATTHTDEIVAKQLEIAYLRFQREHRGDEEDLKNRQKEYVTLLDRHLSQTELAAGRRKMLDVACGDGVFLEVLKQRGWEPQGVDLNQAMVKLGQNRGLDITHGDAIEFLEAQEPKSFAAVSMLQFVEHLPPPVLVRVLKGAYRALRPGGLLLVETINPHTLKALHWYHFDLTHNRLIFPEMMELLAETVGFSPIEWRGINPVAESERLKVEGSETEQANQKLLNRFLFGEQDYYFLARRPIPVGG